MTQQLAVRRIRFDALPEGAGYEDDGCEVAPRCTECPLTVCRYDVPGGLRALRNATRDQQIRALHRDGVAVDEISERFRLHRRSVFRILAVRPPSAAKVAPHALPVGCGGLETGRRAERLSQRPVGQLPAGRRQTMPVARSLDHLDMILVKFRDSPHLEAFRQPGHLDDPCGYCLGMLDDVGATHEEASHIFEHTPRRIREQVRAAIVQGVDAGVPVKFVGVMTRDAEASVEVTGSEAIEGQERVLVTFKVPLRQREACAV